jgi:hypothetical protein
MSTLLVRSIQQVAKSATAFHLWCAECELRKADSTMRPTPLLLARARNLDLLRAYRRRGEFPHNVIDRTHRRPCFVDPDGRRCAVAFLMEESGATDVVGAVVRQANHARIGDMQFPELERWSAEAGLSKADLARIQPAYPPEATEVTRLANLLVPAANVGALAFNSILFNVIRLACFRKLRLTTISLGIAVGCALVMFGLFFEGGFHSHQLQRWMGFSQSLAVWLGLSCLVVAAIALVAFIRAEGPARHRVVESVATTNPSDDRFRSAR